MSLARFAIVSALCWAMVGCNGSPPPTEPRPPTAPPWQVTFEQDRPDADTPNADVKLRNNTPRPVVVRGIRISWPGYDASGWQPADMPFEPGHVHRIDIRLVGPACDEGRDERPEVELLFRDHSTTSVPLDDPGVHVLRNIWGWQCERRRLFGALDIALTGWRRVRHNGEPALRGFIGVRRRDADGDVTLQETRGSVLLEFERVGSDVVLMEPEDDAGRLPFLVASTGRCDPHSLGQSSQTYTFRIWLSLDGGPPRALVIRPRPDVRRRMDRLIYQTCDLAELESG
jgi:hypothetical protein